MDYEEIQTRVFAAMNNVVSRYDKERLKIALSLDTRFMDLDFDSLDGAEFACELSDILGLEVPEEELCTLRGDSSRAYQNITLKDVVDYISRNYSRFEKTSSRV